MHNLPIGLWGQSGIALPFSHALFLDNGAATGSQRGELTAIQSDMEGWGEFTADLWYRSTNSFAAHRTLFATQGSNSSSGFRGRITGTSGNGDLAAAIRLEGESATFRTFSGAPINAAIQGQWIHAGYSWKGGVDAERGLRAYQNGVFYSNFTINGTVLDTDPALAFTLGRNAAGDGTTFHPFTGLISLARVWDRALSDAEMLDVWDREIPDDYPNLHFQYSFPDGSLNGVDPNGFPLQLVAGATVVSV